MAETAALEASVNDRHQARIHCPSNKAGSLRRSLEHIRGRAVHSQVPDSSYALLDGNILYRLIPTR
jgi:hypothetical protein